MCARDDEIASLVLRLAHLMHAQMGWNDNDKKKRSRQERLQHDRRRHMQLKIKRDRERVKKASEKRRATLEKCIRRKQASAMHEATVSVLSLYGKSATNTIFFAGNPAIHTCTMQTTTFYKYNRRAHMKLMAFIRNFRPCFINR